jgi:glycosyltransferase involved in cell wall biosynthesis
MLAYPRLVRSAAVIVHSSFAADMLIRKVGRGPSRLEVIRLPATRPQASDRSEARRALGWPEHSLIAVLPGVIKSVKLAREALAAASGMPHWQLALAGRVSDRNLVAAAHAEGALVLPNPTDVDYERAVVASDSVLCLRAGSVGETNAPLLDALGAGRAILATATGSIPEVASDAALYCDGTPAGIRSGLAALAEPGTRAALEEAARRQASSLTWQDSAARHAALVREVFDR